MIDALEDADDYAAFQMAVTSDYDAESTVERELVLRLASLLWRLRRATAIETGLLKIQALQLLQFRNCREAIETSISRAKWYTENLLKPTTACGQNDLRNAQPALMTVHGRRKPQNAI